MNLQINRTDDGVKNYPLHTHAFSEIMFYLEGTGCMKTEQGDFPFSSGTIIIVPKGVAHGSQSENGFKNISVCGNFYRLQDLKEVSVLSDNANNDGLFLAKTIYNNRFSDKEYLETLCMAYLLFIRQNLSVKNPLSAATENIISEITKNYSDTDFKLSDLLNKSNYSEDYIRAYFKKVTKKTPTEFLTDVRIKHACFLIGIYRDNLALNLIAERCGYTDYVYFSKQFKKTTGVSPSKYKDLLP